MRTGIDIQWNQKLRGGVQVCNDNDTELLITARRITVDNPNHKRMITQFEGENLKNGGGCLYINGHAVPLGGKADMELTPPINLEFVLKVPSKSAIRIDSIQAFFDDEAVPLVEQCTEEADVLVVTPDYPSTENLYLCAFVHSRVRAYVEQGLKVQVAAIGERWYDKLYTFEGVSVYSGHYSALKKLLSRKQYKVIVTHFVDVPLMQIYDGYVTNEKLIFICHGPETTFRRLDNLCRPYFTAPILHEEDNPAFDEKERYIKKYAHKDNVDWVFVSDFLKRFSEECCLCTFGNSHIIHNMIDERRFPYHKKTAEQRKRIMILRKFDNISVHAIDESVLAILELSRRPCFQDLSFEVYGDGSYWEELIAPIQHFENVQIHRTFVANQDIHKLFKKNGILLVPSRHDSQGVIMGEGASSGMVVIGSNVTCIPEFMNQEANHTCAAPESYAELADIIERLYNNPDEFLQISERMSCETQGRCCAERTVMEEVRLISDKLTAYENSELFSNLKKDRRDEPVLSIVVPAYQVESYLEKCLYSLCNHRNAHKTEIIVVNDGSRDRTSEIAHVFERMTGGIVSVIDKENGGHGSTINAGIQAATGKYFRLIDGDDWVDSENLAKLVDILEHEQSDLVLTKGCYEYAEKARLENIIDYPMLREGVQYHFDDLLYPNYGFATYGPLLTTGNYKTCCLKKAAFHISEKKPYVDMEFNAYAQRYIDTVVHYDLDIYRYLIGREGQTVSRDYWKKKYNDHRFIIFNILKTLDQWPDYSEWKKTQYVYKHIIAMMVDSQVFMYDQLCLWNEIDLFLNELGQWPDALKASVGYIQQKNHDSAYILNHYQQAICTGSNNPMIGVDGTRMVFRENKKLHGKKAIKKMMKAILPYGLIRIYQKKHYGM